MDVDTGVTDMDLVAALEVVEAAEAEASAAIASDDTEDSGSVPMSVDPLPSPPAWSRAPDLVADVDKFNALLDGADYIPVQQQRASNARVIDITMADLTGHGAAALPTGHGVQLAPLLGETLESETPTSPKEPTAETSADDPNPQPHPVESGSTGAGYYNTADLEDVKAQSKKNALNINYEGRRDQEEEISGPAHRPFRTGTAAAAKELSDCIKGVGTDVIAKALKHAFDTRPQPHGWKSKDDWRPRAAKDVNGLSSAKLCRMVPFLFAGDPSETGWIEPEIQLLDKQLPRQVNRPGGGRPSRAQTTEAYQRQVTEAAENRAAKRHKVALGNSVMNLPQWKCPPELTNFLVAMLSGKKYLEQFEGIQYNLESRHRFPFPTQTLQFPAASLFARVSTRHLELEGVWVRLEDPFSPEPFRAYYKRDFGQPQPQCKFGCGPHVVADVTLNNPMSGWNPSGPRSALDRRSSGKVQRGFYLSRLGKCSVCSKTQLASDPEFVRLLPAEVQDSMFGTISKKDVYSRQLMEELLSKFKSPQAFNEVSADMQNWGFEDHERMLFRYVCYRRTMSTKGYTRHQSTLAQSANGITLITSNLTKDEIWPPPARFDKGTIPSRGQMIKLGQTAFESGNRRRKRHLNFYSLGAIGCLDMTFFINRAMNNSPYSGLWTFLGMDQRVSRNPQFACSKSLDEQSRYLEVWSKECRAHHFTEVHWALQVVHKHCDGGSTAVHYKNIENDGGPHGAWSCLPLTMTALRDRGWVFFEGTTLANPLVQLVRKLPSTEEEAKKELSWTTRRLVRMNTDNCCQDRGLLVAACPDLMTNMTDEALQKYGRAIPNVNYLHYKRDEPRFLDAVQAMSDSRVREVAFDIENTVRFEANVTNPLSSTFQFAYVCPEQQNIVTLVLHIPNNHPDLWAGVNAVQSVVKLKQFLEADDGPDLIGVNVKGDITKLRNAFTVDDRKILNPRDAIEFKDCLIRAGINVGKTRKWEGLIKLTGLEGVEKVTNPTSIDWDQPFLSRVAISYAAGDVFYVLKALLYARDKDDVRARIPTGTRPIDLLPREANEPVYAAGGVGADRAHAVWGITDCCFRPAEPIAQRWHSILAKAMTTTKQCGAASTESAIDSVLSRELCTKQEAARKIANAIKNQTFTFGGPPQEILARLDAACGLILKENERLCEGDRTKSVLKLEAYGHTGPNTFEKLMNGLRRCARKGCHSYQLNSRMNNYTVYGVTATGKLEFVSNNQTSLDENSHGGMNRLLRSGISAPMARCLVPYYYFHFSHQASKKGEGRTPEFTHLNIDLSYALNGVWSQEFGEPYHKRFVNLDQYEFGLSDQEMECFPRVRLPGVQSNSDSVADTEKAVEKACSEAKAVFKDYTHTFAGIQPVGLDDRNEQPPDVSVDFETLLGDQSAGILEADVVSHVDLDTIASSSALPVCAMVVEPLKPHSSVSADTDLALMELCSVVDDGTVVNVADKLYEACEERRRRLETVTQPKMVPRHAGSRMSSSSTGSTLDFRSGTYTTADKCFTRMIGLPPDLPLTNFTERKSVALYVDLHNKFNGDASQIAEAFNQIAVKRQPESPSHLTDAVKCKAFGKELQKAVKAAKMYTGSERILQELWKILKSDTLRDCVWERLWTVRDDDRLKARLNDEGLRLLPHTTTPCVGASSTNSSTGLASDEHPVIAVPNSERQRETTPQHAPPKQRTRAPRKCKICHQALNDGFHLPPAHPLSKNLPRYCGVYGEMPTPDTYDQDYFIAAHEWVITRPDYAKRLGELKEMRGRQQKDLQYWHNQYSAHLNAQ